MKTLIFGCGYLGYQVARLWRDQRHDVSVVTRSSERAEKFATENLVPILADITRPETLNDLPEVDAVLFAVGFDRSTYKDIRDVYVTGLDHVLSKLNNRIGQLIYISSTGVYGNCHGEWVTEESTADPLRKGGQACLEAEALIANSSFANRSTILRLAGIYGKNRVPRLEAIKQREWSSLGNSGHINLIHVADAAQIVNEIVNKKIVNETLLVSDGQPTLRKNFYDAIAKHIGVGPIDWTVQTDSEVADRSKADKKTSNKKLIEATGYQFIYPNYQSGLQDALKSR